MSLCGKRDSVFKNFPNKQSAKICGISGQKHFYKKSVLLKVSIFTAIVYYEGINYISR